MIEIVFDIPAGAVSQRDAASSRMPDIHIIVAVDAVSDKLCQLKRSEAVHGKRMQNRLEHLVFISGVGQQRTLLFAKLMVDRCFLMEDQRIK